MSMHLAMLYDFCCSHCHGDTQEQRRILQLQADGHYEMHVREGSVPTVRVWCVCVCVCECVVCV